MMNGLEPALRTIVISVCLWSISPILLFAKRLVVYCTVLYCDPFGPLSYDLRGPRTRLRISLGCFASVLGFAWCSVDRLLEVEGGR